MFVKTMWFFECKCDIWVAVNEKAWWHMNILIPARISNNMPGKVLDENTDTFPNFNVSTTEDWWWISNLIPHFVMDVITHSCWAIGFNHGLPWCVKYMALGPPVTTKPDGEAGGFCGDRRPEGHVFHTSRQAMIKTYYSTPTRKKMVQNCCYFTQKKMSTTTAIDDSNRRRNKIGLGCSREGTAPLILIFELLFCWLNIDWYFKGITHFFTISTHQNILAKILPGNQYLPQNMYKNDNVDLHFYRHRRSFVCREWFSAGTHLHFAEVPYTLVLGKEVKWDSDITTTWLTSGKGNVFDCIKRDQKWQF